ncbi:MAG: glycosyl transferase family protein [candidate division WS6 bacterium 34_10]|uniref:Glycosyl transferase family protein n=1 Tax=candidate division WS6 bacterium 34_10 TaxID=1641389 RepID=A0A101HGW0_9BACT|nr:MAG: glycosyl transferase family protein [candidate division WS6 bacterium 34_10]
MDYAIPTQFFKTLTTVFSPLIGNPVLSKYIAFIPIALIAFLATFLLTPIIGKIAWSIGATYKPNTKRRGKDFDNPAKAMHEVETPSLGGLSVTLPAFIITFLSFQITPFTAPILLALLVLMIGSTLDDIFNLDSRIQFGYQILASLIIVLSIIDLTQIGLVEREFLNFAAYTVRFDIFKFPISVILPGDIFLFFWLLLCLNAVKWVGGSPGLLESYSAVIFTLLFIVAIRMSSDFTAVASIAMSGSLLAFLVFAIPPEKIMSGSSGRSVYGFMIALLALISDAKISTSIMLLALPILDAIYVIVRRIFVHKPKSLKELLEINDTTHLHHRLLQLKLTRIQVLLLETSIALIIGSIAIATTGAMRYFAVIFGLALILLLIVIINNKANKRKESEKEKSPESKYSY